MALSDRIKPISYVKSHASMILRELAEQGKPLIITQNGEAKAVLQDVVSYEQTQETMALLKILALAVNDQELDGSSRSYALATLYEQDAARGKVLARRYSGGCPGALRKKARALVAKK